jgi:hypothetical protein
MLNAVAFAPLIKGERGIFGITYEILATPSKRQIPRSPFIKGANDYFFRCYLKNYKSQTCNISFLLDRTNSLKGVSP